MSFYFLTPITSQTIGQQTANAPKYLATVMAGLGFSCIPYGAEGWGIVGLQNANPALSAEADVYTFGDPSTVMTDADVATLSAYLATANVPSDQIVAGMTFGVALQTIAKIFLVAQAIAGSTGSSIFAEGSTLDTAVGDTTAASIVPAQTNNKLGKVGSVSSGGSASSQLGPFDLSGVSASDTVGDTLDSISQQFTDTVIL
jgi:hypothetical protein